MKKDLTVKDASTLDILSEDEAQLLSKEIVNVRDEVRDCPYLEESLRVLPVKGYRSAIGSYWNSIVDDLRNKIIHRSLDLFNKEVEPRKKIKKYEDFQDYVTDNELIEGAYKIGVLSWEGRKLMHQCRETRNMFHGHPKSSDPGLLKVLNLISDCNRYVLSQEFPPSIIDISTYLNQMDSSDYSRNRIAVDQAFTDLPSIYKTELANRFFASYAGDSISSDLRGNIEFCAPVLWTSLSKDDKKQIGKSFDKLMVEGDSKKIARGLDFVVLVDCMMYVSGASRRMIIEPMVTELGDSLDSWDDEARICRQLKPLSRFVPQELKHSFVTSLTRTFVGKKGSSYRYSRSDFYSDSAAPLVKEMFESFDSESSDIFVEIIKKDGLLRRRISKPGQLQRLRALGNIILERDIASSDTETFLSAMCNEKDTDKFMSKILPQIRKS